MEKSMQALAAVPSNQDLSHARQELVMHITVVASTIDPGKTPRVYASTSLSVCIDRLGEYCAITMCNISGDFL